MEEKTLYDITEVCKMLGTTSRTLRFYEEKGLIQSTLEGLSTRRKYTKEQILRIQNVLVLRMLGLSIKTIAGLAEDEDALKNAVLLRRAEISASIESRAREIELLGRALAAMDAGRDIFAEDFRRGESVGESEKEIAKLCAEAIISGDTDTLYTHLGTKLSAYLPKEVYEIKRRDTFSVLGDFLFFDKMEVDETYPNKIYCFLIYEKLGLKITFVFHGGKIDGLWFSYEERKSGVL